MARKPPKGESLADLYPNLVKEWHLTKNGDLTPFDVMPGSEKKVWWKCPNGDDHEWEASGDKRKNGRGCPVCNSQKVVVSNCLSTTHSEIAKQWHPTKNGKLLPNNYLSASHKKVWWKCPNGDDHEWVTRISHRVKGGCPICSHRKIVKSNCLATTHPNLLKELHPDKNNNLNIYSIGAGSHQKV